MKYKTNANTKNEGVISMYDPKKPEPKQIPKPDEDPKEKRRIRPGEIIGKVDVHDTRERRDGPGGN